MKDALKRLAYLCNIIPPLLYNLTEEQFTYKTVPNKWSKKEIIGHLIDSATNNHHRLIRAQFEDEPLIVYNQDLWNIHGYHQRISSVQLIRFWESYNRHLLAIIQEMPTIYLKRKIYIGKEAVSIDFLVIDYVKHLEHHLKQIVDY